MIRIGQPSATIDTPLEHLMACHRRIEERLTTLERAGERLREDRPAALEAILRSILFLDSSGVLHTRDEEESVFPRLLPHLTPEELRFLKGLEEQHRVAEAVFGELKDVTQLMAADSCNALGQESRYKELADRLCALYRPHIQSEDEVLTRIARRTLTNEQLNMIAAEMKERRGLAALATGPSGGAAPSERLS
jgi:hemerythrin-like domain-containing protein